MTVHSTQLGANSAVTTAGATLYTCPAGKRTIVKSVVLENTASASQRVFIEVVLHSGGAIQPSVTLGANPSATEAIVWSCWIVLNAGDSIKIQPSANGVQAIVSGTELIL